MYEFDAEGLVMKQHARHSFSICSSSINNYDAQEMEQPLNESVYKAAEEV